MSPPSAFPLPGRDNPDVQRLLPPQPEEPAEGWRSRQPRRPGGLMRLEFRRTILQRGMGFSPSDLNCLVKLPGLKEVFELRPLLLVNVPVIVSGRDLVPPFTWVSSSGTSFSCIDLVLHTKTAVDTQAVFFSDHRLLQKTREKQHLMSSMLDSSGRIVEFIERVKKVVENFYRDLYNIKATDDTLIEWFLSQLKPDSEERGTRTNGYFIAAGKRKAKERRAKYKHLNAALQCLSLLQLWGFPVSDEIAQTKFADMTKMTAETVLYGPAGGIMTSTARTTKKVVDRIIHRFVWGSKMERVKQATMNKAEKKGGKGVLDVVQLIRVQGLMETIKNIQALDRNVCYMNRFYFATCLRALSICTIHNTVPYSWDPPLYYRIFRDTVYKLGLDKAKLASWEYKAVTKHLAGSQEIVKVATFSLTQSQKIWENVAHSCLSNVQKDIAWNTVHSSLPTRAFMFRRGLAQVETCPYAKCRKRETPAHIFWECDVAGSVWLSVSVFLNRFADTAKMTAETVLYGPAGGIATSTAKCVWRVINVVKQILWEGRNVCVYHKQELDTITTTRRAQTIIKDFVILDIRTLGKDKA
ncbi:UNVERIFIED_CONTAM: hypothetical protein FKN15_065371 [Acipenser sinensis]